MKTDLKKWEELLPLMKKAMVNHWANHAMELPWGFTLTFDDLVRVYLDDVTGFTLQEILRFVRVQDGRKNLVIRVYFTPAFTGDIMKTRQYLKTHGFTKQPDQLFFWTDRIKAPVATKGYVAKLASDMKPFIKFTKQYFESGLPYKTRLQALAKAKKINRKFFTIYGYVGNKIISTVGAVVSETVAFGHSLLTLPAYRGQGAINTVLCLRAKLLADAGIKSIFTDTYADNKASIAVQKRQGFKVVVKLERWISQ